MEKLEYLIRTYTYRRSVAELQRKASTDPYQRVVLAERIVTSNECISEIYSLIKDAEG